jgi:hypothetical protein
MPAAKGSARTPLGPKTTTRKGKILKIVATFVYASSQGQHTHSAQTNYQKRHVRRQVEKGVLINNALEWEQLNSKSENTREGKISRLVVMVADKESVAQNLHL